MAQKRRLLLTGSERAEFEHIYGPLTVDETDPRFVLVDEETESKIAALPPGVPVRQGQHPADLAAIRAAELDAWGIGDEVQGGKGGLVAKELDVEPAGQGGDRDEPTSGGEVNEAVAESGKPAYGEPVEPSAESRAKK